MSFSSLTHLDSKRWWMTFAVVLQFSYRSVVLRKAAWFGVLIFSFSLLVLYPFGFGPEMMKRTDIRIGAFWTINEFMVALVVSRLFAAEQEGSALELLLSSRSPRSAILAGKIFFTALQLFSLQVPLFLGWLLLYNIPPSEFVVAMKTLLPIAVCFNLGTASVGALVTCATARSMAKEILVPILFYPLQVALLLAAVTLSLRNDPDQVMSTLSSTAWWSILIGYPFLFTATGFLLSDNLLQE